VKKANKLTTFLYLVEEESDEELSLEPEEDSSKLAKTPIKHKFISANEPWLTAMPLPLLEATDQHQSEQPDPPKTVRIYSPQEAIKIGIECQGFLLLLERIGILDMPIRELIIERIMDLEIQELELEQLKLVILVELFNQPGYETAFAQMENLLQREHNQHFLH